MSPLCYNGSLMEFQQGNRTKIVHRDSVSAMVLR